jgi:signal transduction histidine kinase
VSHEIVRGHGGEISVVSSPGKGATFEVRLPLAPP